MPDSILIAAGPSHGPRTPKQSSITDRHREARQAFAQELINNHRFFRAVLNYLLKHQTVTERNLGYSTERNGQGFTSPDSKLLTRIAEKVAAGEPLTDREHDICLKRLPKYWRQCAYLLLVIAPKKSVSSETATSTETDLKVIS